MNRFRYAALVLLTGVPASAQETDANPYDTREESIEDASAIKISGAIKATVITGSEDASVRFQGPAEMVADAQASVIDGLLTIGYRDDKTYSWNPSAGLNAVISLPSLSSVTTHGAAQVDVLGARGKAFSATTNGAGRIKVAQLYVEHVNAAIGGSGKIELEGHAEEARYAIGGAGSIEGKRLRVENAQIAIGGAGSVYADVSDQAAISVGGSGKVEVVGGAKCTVSPEGARNVECR